jgi:hypothetical protein
MYIIKPSILEDFRIYKYQIFPKELKDVIEGIKGERKPSPQMNMGKLIHHYLETGQTEIVFEGKKYSLHDKEVDILYPLYHDLQLCIREMRFRSQLTDDILISGRADAVYGRIGIEVKTGARFYGMDFYTNSDQWKLYSLGLDLSMLTYIHIEIGGTYPPHILTMQDFDLYPYPGMKDEVIGNCYEFIKFCEFHNLIPYIT